MRKNLKYVLLALFLAAMVYAGCTYEYSLDPYHNKVNPNGAKVDTTGVTEYEGISISNSFLPVNFDGTERKVLEADTASGHFTMKADDQTLKQLGVGSIVAFDTDSIMFLRKVRQVHIDNGVASMETEEAGLFDVIRSGRFGLAIDSSNTVMTRSTRGFDDGKDYPVFRPYEMRYQDDDGNWHRESFRNTSTRGDGKEEEWKEDDSISGYGNRNYGQVAYKKIYKKFSASITPSIVGYGMSVDGEYTHSYREGANFNIVMDINLIGTSRIQCYKESDTWDTTKVNLTLKGGKIDNSFANKVEKDKIPLFSESFRIGSVYFMIGVLPVYIEFKITPEISLEIGSSAFFNIEVQQVKIKQGEKSGIDFATDNGAHRINENGKTIKDEFKVTNLSGGGETSAKFAFTPKFSLMFWGMTGIYVGFEMYDQFTFTLGAGLTDSDGERIITPEDKKELGFGYQAKEEKGGNLVAGIDVGFLKKLIKKLDKLENSTSFSYQILPPAVVFEAPKTVKCLTPKYDINIGKRNTIDFMPFYSFYLKEIPFVLPYYIYCESTGDELLYTAKDPYAEEGEDEIGFSMPTNKLSGFTNPLTGKYSVYWTPTSAESQLLAYIKGPDGKELGSVLVKPSSSGIDCTPVDMGTSCLWAPMNVGAKIDTDRGDYVGWGDATGRHKEQGAYSSADGTAEVDDEVLKGYYGGKKASTNISGSRRDYATAKWGGDWRMPTKKEWQELIDNCTWVWNAELKGYFVFNRENHDNYLFIPANGYRLGTEYAEVGRNCHYWSANLYKTSEKNDKVSIEGMEAFYFSGRPHHAEDRQLHADYHTPRYFGQAVRPVMDKPNEFDFSNLDY